MDDLNFLEGEEPVAEPVIEQEAVVEEQAPQPEPEPENKPVMVPLAALHEVRDEVRQLKSRLAEQEQQQVELPAPDPIEDLDAFNAYQARIANNAALNAKLDLSEDLAREKFGDDVVDQALDWVNRKATEMPGFGQKVLSQRNPYGFAVAEYQKEQMASQVKPDEWSQFQAWKAAQAQVNAAQAAPQVEEPKTIAAAPSAAGVQHVAMGDAAIFDDFFKR